MKKILLALLFSLISFPVFAQITVPNTFVTGTKILASEMNANFDALESDSLNRTGGTITGNIVVSAGVTIDGIDIGAVLGGTGTPTFASLTVTGAGTFGTTLGVTGDVTVNTNKFTVTAASGNTLIAGTLTAGSGAVGILDSTGKIPAITSTYFVNTSPVFSVAAKVGIYTATTADAILTANGTFTINLYTCVGNTGRVLEIKNIGSGVITIDGNGAETIDGAATQTLDGQYFSYTLACDGTGWHII